VDDLIADLGHEPNGVFWEGIAELLCVHVPPHVLDAVRASRPGAPDAAIAS
jgi:hypothetical protein